MTKSEHKQASLTGSLEIEEPDPSHEECPQDGDRKYEKNNRLLGEWLDINFRNKGTKENYYTSLQHFLGIVYPGECNKPQKALLINASKNERIKAKINRRNEIDWFIDKYIEDHERVLLSDFKACIIQLGNEKYAPSTINTIMSKIRKFFDRLDTEKYSIKKRDMDDIKSSLMPAFVTVTKDEIPTKDEVKLILTYLSVKDRALFLFLISSSVRIGAALQLKIVDLNLDVYPPEAEIRSAYTKGGVGGRTVWFTNETKEALLAWLNVKDTYLKKSGGYFDKKLVFGVSYRGVLQNYHRALKKANLDQRDPNTKTRIRKYHIHTLRKFFRTQMGDAGMPDMITHALMGHKAYLSEAYDRPRELAKTYVKYMHAVTIFEKDLETEMRDKLAKGETEIEELQTERQETKMTLSIIAMNLDISNPHDLASDSLLIQINNAIARMKKTLASNAEEIAYLKETRVRETP